jgi:hypothetical protein
VRDAHRLRQIEVELTNLAREVRGIHERVPLESVRAAFVKQDLGMLNVALLSAADEAKRIRIPRAGKVPA